jgi:hypothetical protein
VILPAPVKRAIKSALRPVRRAPRWESLVYLEYDLQGLKAELESTGLRCRLEDFPGARHQPFLGYGSTSRRQFTPAVKRRS